nr:ral guanine nucleotide dissociation stimulator-like 1 [Danio rerio]|eukprot:XP_021327881.1 ral guanine nucleotide dissociation stimulator-like 1 [Danio rerio]
MGKWELTMEPVQEWGEEHEDGAVFGVTLRREPVQQSAEPTEAFVHYRTCKVRRLKAATLDKLVSHLLDPCCQEQDYSCIMLSTYRSFTSTNKLIETLFQRKNLASVLDSINYPNSCLWTVLQLWLDEYSEDFRDSPMHSSLRLMCLKLRGHPSLFPLAKQYEALLKRFQTEDVVAAVSADLTEESNLNMEMRNFEFDNMEDFLDFSIMGVAEQLTRIDADLFVKVVPFQCLGCVWSQRDKNENLSPSVWATITQFNAVTNRVITSLLNSPTSTASQRARVIEKWVRVAQGCRELKNFSSLKAILSALQSNPVYRLRKTWAAVSRYRQTTHTLCRQYWVP